VGQFLASLDIQTLDKLQLVLGQMVLMLINSPEVILGLAGGDSFALMVASLLNKVCLSSTVLNPNQNHSLMS
jgi:hypothetical protein